MFWAGRVWFVRIQNCFDNLGYCKFGPALPSKLGQVVLGQAETPSEFGSGESWQKLLSTQLVSDMLLFLSTSFLCFGQWPWFWEGQAN